MHRSIAIISKRFLPSLSVVMLAAACAGVSSSFAQEKTLKDQVVGTWIYVSSSGKRDDGSNVPRPSLQGAVTYTADGRFHFITTRTDTPRYASNDPARPSPEEALAVASGSIAYTGHYTVENLVGAPNQRRIVTSISGDELRLTNPRTPAGVTLEFVWKRAR